jgi:hypothetical protein
MRDHINYDNLTEEDIEKAARLFVLFGLHDACKDPFQKERFVEEIRSLKKQLLNKIVPAGIECVVAGDKDADKVDLVVCAEATPDAVRVAGTIEVPCSKCGKLVLLSPDSPKGPPKACYDCAWTIAQKQSMEDGQDSLGA